MPDKLVYANQDVDDIINTCRGYRKQLIEYCMKYLKTFEDAEDCVSFAFTALVENLKNGKEIRNPKAWLYKVSINEAIRLERERSRLPENSYADSNHLDSMIYYTPDYLEELVDDEKINRCAVSIIEKLDSDEKNLYIKYYGEKKSLKEISDETSISYIAVRKRHQRLKEKLVRLIDEVSEDYYEVGGDSVENGQGKA